MTTTPGPLNILYVAWGFAPHRGPGTYRALATVNALVSEGHRVTVLTADLANFDVVTGADRSLMDAIDPAVNVVRVGFPVGRRDPIVSRWDKDRAHTPPAWRDRMTARELAVFPEAVYALWKQRADAAAYRMHRQDPFDLVIGTGNPYVDFSPAFHLGVEFGVPFILDDRDSWLLDVYTGEQLDADGPSEALWESMQRRCLEAWFVNEPIADWYRKRFPDLAHKVRVVENGWDGAYLTEARGQKVADPAAPVFGFVGTMSKGMPLELVLDAWRIARPRLGPNAELRFYGQLGHAGFGEMSQVSLLDRNKPYGVKHLGRWPKTEIDHAYGQLDVLIFAKEGGSMVTSAKIYEYVATGRPIVTVADSSVDSWRVMRGYPRTHQPRSMTPKDLAETFVAAWQDAREADPGKIAQALEIGERLERRNQLLPALRAVVEAVRA